MIASDFTQPARPEFPRWARYTSYAALLALGVPLVKVLELAGVWPEFIMRRVGRSRGSFGDYIPSKHDVFVCAGFKSGTTWMLNIAVQIAFRGKAEFDNIHSVVPWPDAPSALARFMIPLSSDSPRSHSPVGLRIIKTHRPQNEVPYSPDARYIALVRDPKDVLVSGYHFVRSLVYGPLMPTVRHWVELFLSGKLPMAPWAEHLASYWRVRHRANVLFLAYEEIARDPRRGIAEIARFMQLELTASELDAVAGASSFVQMKQERSKFDPGRVVPWGGAHSMLRRGQSGASGELLSPKLQREVDDRCRDELRRLGCDFPYDQAFATHPTQHPEAHPGSLSAISTLSRRVRT